MKMKKGLLSVAFLLATSSAMAAMSFSTADVKGDMGVTVKNSSEALLALIANGDHAAPGYNGYGKLDINLDKGHNGNYGVQNDSTYTWKKLFTVKNNSEKEIEVTVQAVKKVGPNASQLSSELEIVEEGEGVEALSWWPPNAGGNNNTGSETIKVSNGSSSNTVTFKLKSGETKDINLEVFTKDKSLSSNKFDLEVKAKRTDGK